MFDVISIGSAIRDIIFRIQKTSIPSNYKKVKANPLICFPYGAKIEPQKAYFLFGGGGVNSAICFSRLGLKSALYSSLGRDGTADAVLEKLKKENVNTNFIIYDKNLHTALSFIIVGSYGERTIFPYAGASGNLKLAKTKPKKLALTKWLYLTTLRKKSQQILSNIDKLLVENQRINLAFNPGEVELSYGLNYLEGIFKKTTVLILNREEAKKLISSKRKLKDYKISYLLKFLKGTGPKMVLITDGRNGAFLIDQDKRYYIASLKSPVIEKTGAGDAFGSGFIAGLLKYNDISLALKLATICACSVIKHVGASDGLPYLKDIKSLIQKKFCLRIYKND
jgi:sugar/nucleoside kinase (ribokinase family)